VKRADRLALLFQLGFDRSHPTGRSGLKVACSQCEAVAINSVPCHETGCPHATHECAGCNELLPMNQKYCKDCQ